MFSTDKPVNISQLAYELGGLPASWTGPDAQGMVTCEPLDGVRLTDDAWDAAVSAHMPDKEWVDPEAVSASPATSSGAADLTVADKLALINLTIDELKKALGIA